MKKIILAAVLFLPFWFLVPRTGKHLLFLLKRLKRSLRKLKLPRCNISPHLISEKDYGLRGSSG